MKEFRRLAFERVPDELKNPSDDEQAKCPPPKTVIEEPGHEDCKGKQNRRYAKCVAQAVDGMLMAGRVLRDPFFVRAVLAGASAKHTDEDDTTASGSAAD